MERAKKPRGIDFEWVSNSWGETAKQFSAQSFKSLDWVHYNFGQCCSLTIKYRITYTQVRRLQTISFISAPCTVLCVLTQQTFFVIHINMCVLAPCSSFAIVFEQLGKINRTHRGTPIACSVFAALAGQHGSRLFFFECLLCSCHWHNVVIQTQIGHFIRYN